MRLIHWSVATIIILNLYILEEGDPAHRYIGYACVFFVFVRCGYGFVVKKNDQSAFKNFPLKLSELKKFILSKLNKTALADDYKGHNPAASWVYLLIWTCILGLGVTGYLMGTDYFFGEDSVQDIHNAFSIFLQILIFGHLSGMALDSFTFKRHSWLAMINGRK